MVHLQPLQEWGRTVCMCQDETRSEERAATPGVENRPPDGSFESTDLFSQVHGWGDFLEVYTENLLDEVAFGPRDGQGGAHFHFVLPCSA